MNLAIRNAILRWFDNALQAVDPARVTRERLETLELGRGRLVVLAIGKAAVPMAQAATDVLGDRIDRGLIVTKSGQLTNDVDGFDAIEAAHPIPDANSLAAGQAVLDAVQNLKSRDTVIALISGGGSSILEYPEGDLTLMDLQTTTELLMYAGAGIHDLNAVRKVLSAIKGGGLRRHIGPARTITLLLSDVLGNDPAVIASGPTVPEPYSRTRAAKILEQYRVEDRVPERVRMYLQSDAPPSEPFDTSRDVVEVIADNRSFVDAIARAATADGMRTRVQWESWAGDARDLAQVMIDDIRDVGDDVDVLLGGGEATAIVRGSGSGGRNTETALQAALLLHGLDWTIASLASDGDDGNSGAAGAIVDASTHQSREAALAALANSDSAGYLTNVNALVAPGPTGNNVNDVYIAVRNTAFGGAEE